MRTTGRMRNARVLTSALGLCLAGVLAACSDDTDASVALNPCARCQLDAACPGALADASTGLTECPEPQCEEAGACPDAGACEQPQCPEFDVCVPPEAAADADVPDTEIGSDVVVPDAGTDAPSGRELRVMTYNIKHGAVSSLGELADVILAEQPDVVALQEVDVDADRSGNVDQPHRLSQLTGMASLFRTAIQFSSGGYYGVALLSRHPILTSERVALTSVGEQRILAIVDVEIGSRVVPIAVTHLGLQEAERVTQAQEILAHIDSQWTILMGDLNAKPTASCIGVLTDVLTDAFASLQPESDYYTMPADEPRSRIDFILTGSAYGAPYGCHVPVTTASDHRPVVASVTLPD